MAEGKSKPPQDIVTEIGVEDLYQFLGVESTSSQKEITTGYRKKALKYHPDKNPDNPDASALFQKLSKAYHILTDPAAKAAYDKWLRAKHAARKRHEELNVKRRKLKESLEMRESQGAQETVDEELAAKLMQKEIDRLREEGYKKMKEQEEILRQQMQKPDNEGEDKSEIPSLKVTWKAKKGDSSNGGYTKELLEEIFSLFGEVYHVLVSKKRNGKAIVSFHNATSAVQAMSSGCGLEGNLLHMTWASGKPVSAGDEVMADSCTLPVERESDYESITLMRLQEAEKRKRTIEQLLQRGSDTCLPRPALN